MNTISSRLNVVDYNLDWALREHNVHERPTPGYLTREEAIAYCGRLQVGGIELMHSYWEDCEPEYLLGLAEDAGIPIRTYIFFCDLAIPPERGTGAVDEARRVIDRCVALGAELGMIVPGVAKREHSLNEQLEWMIEGLSRSAEHAGAAGLTLVSENIDYAPTRPLMGQSSQCRTICSRVDSPHYRLIFDPAPTVFAGEDPLQALHEMMPFLAHVHLKNVLPVNDGEQWHRTQEDHQRRQYRGVNLSEGIIDLPAVLKKLQQQNYQGKFLIEYQGEEDPRDALKKNLVEAQALLKQAGFTT